MIKRCLAVLSVAAVLMPATGFAQLGRAGVVTTLEGNVGPNPFRNLASGSLVKSPNAAVIVARCRKIFHLREPSELASIPKGIDPSTYR